jgi:hypothetical protein
MGALQSFPFDKEAAAGMIISSEKEGKMERGCELLIY